MLAACSGDDAHRHAAHDPAARWIRRAGAGRRARCIRSPRAPTRRRPPPLRAGAARRGHGAGRTSRPATRRPARMRSRCATGKTALAAFTAARRRGKDPAQIARLDLMTGMCHAASSAEWKRSTHDLAAAAPKLPLLADWITYHLRARAVQRPRARRGGDRAQGRGRLDRRRRGRDPPRRHRARQARRRRDRRVLPRLPRAPPEGPAPQRSALRPRDRARGQRAGRGRASCIVAIQVDDPLSSWATKAEKHVPAPGGKLR